MGSYFGIGLGYKVIALGNEFFLEFQIVFDDAVMQAAIHDRNGGDGALMSLGTPWVAQRVWAMPQVPVSGEKASFSSSFWMRPWDFTVRMTPSSKTRDTRRIIAAVFQVAQSFQQYFGGLSEATVSNYTTHNRITPYSVLKVHIYKADFKLFLWPGNRCMCSAGQGSVGLVSQRF